MNLEHKNVISWIDKISEDLEGIQKHKKEFKKELNETRLQVSLLEPQIGTEINLLELEGMEINYAYFNLESRTLNAEQKFLGSQLNGVQNELLGLSKLMISLECEMNVIKHKCSDAED